MAVDWREITVQAQLSRLPGLMEFAARAAEEAGVEDTSLLYLQMAVEELATNIIKYAYPQATGPMSLAWRKDPAGFFFLRLKDQGRAFNPLQAPEPDVNAAMDQRQPGGLGIHLTSRLMDRLEYAREGDENVLTLALRLPGAAGEA